MGVRWEAVSDAQKAHADEPSLDALVARMHAIADECIDSYASLAKRAAQAWSGADEDRRSWVREAWMTWADNAGHWVEAAYLSVVLADRINRPGRDRD
jgi:hypothetical protein